MAPSRRAGGAAAGSGGVSRARWGGNSLREKLGSRGGPAPPAPQERELEEGDARVRRGVQRCLCREAPLCGECVGEEGRGGHARVRRLTGVCVEVCVENGSACVGRVPVRVRACRRASGGGEIRKDR